jgi:cytochrome c-type biogenesis protein CcmH
MPGRSRLVAAGVIVLVVVAGIGYVLLVTRGGPAASTSGDLEARALAVQHQLLCPQCTNERLDVCNLAICNDMKAVIRQRLAAGDPPEVIVAYFRDRYGDRVLAQVPREGFNLVLFAWVGGSVMVVALTGGYFLLSLRRAATPAAPGADGADGGAPDDAWLDRQLAEHEEDA